MKKFNFLNYIFLFVIIFFNLIINALSANIEIVTKINNEIITNVDIMIESRYLSALNKDLNKLNKKDLESIAKESLIKEKIKLSEIRKYYKLEDFNNDQLINSVLNNIYSLLDIENIESFKKYLIENNLKFNDVKEKIKIEILWNQLVGRLYTNQIFIDEERIKEDIKNKKLNVKLSLIYDLSEIVFEVKDGKNLDSIYRNILNDVEQFGFSSAANKYSISDSSKIGGKIGKVNKNQLSEIISDKLKNKSIDEITQPIKVGTGYLILKINNIEKKENVIDENKLLKQLINNERQKQFNQFSLIYFNKVKLNIINDK